MADFSGSADWDSFCGQHTPRTAFDTNKEIIPDTMGLQLLQICLQNHDFKSVIEYTKLLPKPYIVNYETQIKLSELFGAAIRYDLKARKVLLDEFAKIPQGRHFFYETFVDMDNLNGYYGDALDIYDKYLPNLSKGKTLNDLVFTECLRFWSAYKTNNLKKLKRIGYQLFELQSENEIQEGNELHFFPVARWHAYRLIYWHFLGKITQKKNRTNNLSN